MTKHYEVSLEISGPTAMWTRPDTGDAPVSYPAPTWSAAKGVFESILWIPGLEVTPTKVEICTPLVFHTYTTNYRGPLRKSRLMKQGSSYQLIATVLINVRYRLYGKVRSVSAQTRLTDRSRTWTNSTSNPVHAYQEIFNRRVRRGQCYAIPCLGWKEFVPDYVGTFCEGTEVCQDITLRLPSMLHKVFGSNETCRFSPIYKQEVEIKRGVLTYVE
ncbi:MAG: CRISPR-associated protein Cas5 [Nitrospira sp.]|nr:CRISPR-associated protein Cas5 [Nitrospira sp.]